MAIGTLENTTIAARYKSLLKLTGTANDVLHATTLKLIEDGDGNDSALQLAQNRLEIVPVANHANAFEVSQTDGTQIFNINSSTPGLTVNAATITLTQDTNFVTSGGVNGMSIDGTTLSIDGNANRVGVNTATPASTFHVQGDTQIGIDGTAYDVVFYSDTEGDNMTWDESAARLIITGTNGTVSLNVADGDVTIDDNLAIENDLAVNGTSNLDNTDIDGTFRMDGTTFDVNATAALTIDSTSSATDAVNIGVSAGGMLIAPTLADGKLLRLGKAGAVEMQFAPHSSVAQEKISIANTTGTAADATAIVSVAGGVTLAGNTTHGVLVGTISAAPVSIGHTTSETTVNDNLTVTGSFNTGVVTLAATGNITKDLHSGKTLLLAEDGGDAIVTLTLPDATGSGCVYKFIILIRNSSNYVITCPDVDNTIDGSVIMHDSDDTSVHRYNTVDATDTITLNNGNQGGMSIGDFIELTDIGANQWVVNGVLTSNSSPASPFS